MAMSPNCVDTEQIPSKMVAGDREILGIGENPKSFGESRVIYPAIPMLPLLLSIMLILPSLLWAQNISGRDITPKG